MENIIHETMTCGPCALYSNYLDKDKILIEAHENYQKRSYRNRYFISGPNGVIPLSIPLMKGKNHHTPIKDVKISYDLRWTHRHIHTIKSCYGSSPYYMHYEEEILSVFEENHTFLIDFNLRMMMTFIHLTDIGKKIEQTESYEREYASGDYRNYYSIKKLIHHDVKYPQVFEEKFGFISGLSILDLLFCTGPESKLYLSHMKATS